MPGWSLKAATRSFGLVCHNNTSAVAFLIGVLVLGHIFIVIYPIQLELNAGRSPLQLAIIVFFRFCLYYWFFHTVGYWFYKILPLITPSARQKTQLAPLDDPKVAVIVPVRNEPESVIERMLEALVRIDYAHFEAVIVDNSSIPLRSGCGCSVQELGLSLRIVRKKDTKGFKAGALNAALHVLDDRVRYVLVLDVDHAPEPEILKILVPVLHANEEAAFVQAPQKFEIIANNMLSYAYSSQQRVFYDHLCPGMSLVNSLFMTGTNMLVRREALDETGGFDESTLTEDIRTSLTLHLRGWRGMFVRETVAVGYPPPGIASYHRQQRRWAIGTFQNLFDAWRLFLRFRNMLKIEQWLQYLGFNGTWYLQGFCNVFLVWSSLAFLLTEVEPSSSILDILLVVLVFLTVAYQIANEHKERKTAYFTLLLSQSVFWGNSIIFVLAFMDLVFRHNLSFDVTKKVKASAECPSAVFLIYHGLFVFASSVAMFSFFWSRSSWSLTFLPWVLFFTLQSLMSLLTGQVLRGKPDVGLRRDSAHVC